MKKKVDLALKKRAQDIMQIEGIGWDDFRRRFFKCPWCMGLIWRMIRRGENSMVLCVGCKMPYMSNQVIDFWEAHYIAVEKREEERLRLLKKAKDDEIIRNMRFFMGDKRLPIFRIDKDEPDD